MDHWLRRWLFTTNHKDVGILYLVTALYFAFLGGLLAMLMRVQLAVPLNTVLQPGEFNQAVTMHGLLMVLWFLSPLGFAFANYFVPLQIGAKDLAFPRLNAFSYWLYLFGGLVAALGFFVPGGAAATGWTAYAPLTSSQYSPGAGLSLGAAGLLMLVTSMTMGSVNFLATIIVMRAPGVTWSKLPMFTWFIFFTVLMALFAFPSLLAALLMLVADRVLGTLFFTSASGGAVLWTHLFWFFGHPEVYIILLPAFGVVAEIYQTFSQKPLYARKPVLVAMGILVALSLVVWAHHMFLTGINLNEREAFTASTESISVPFAVLMISFAGTLFRGSVRLKTPMLFALGSTILFVIGGLTGVFNSSLTLDIAFRGTYWVVGHFHYVMVGATIFGLFGAVYYWLPKMTGRMYNEKLGRIHFIFSFIGINLLSLPMHLLIDMPRRVYTYGPDTGWGTLNLTATVGGFLFALAQILLIVNMLAMLKGSVPAGPNPWGASTLEWVPVVTGGSSPQAGGAQSLHQLDGATHHCSGRPVTISLGLALFFVGLFVGLFVGTPLLVVGAAILIWGVVGWFVDDFHGRFSVGEEAGGDRWPLPLPRVKLGMWAFLGSEIIFFGSIIASYAFIRANMPHWPAAGAIHNIPLGMTNTGILLTSSLTFVLALQAVKAGDQRRLLLWLTATFILGSTFVSIKATEWYTLLSKGFNPSSGLPGTSFYFATGIHVAHLTVGLIILAYLIKKTYSGGFAGGEHSTIENFGLYWCFVDIVWVFLFQLFYLL